MLYTGDLLVRCHDAAACISYSSFAQIVMGPRWSLLIPAVNIVGLFGGCTAYVSIAKDIFPYFWVRAGITSSVVSSHVPWYWSTEFWVAIVLSGIALPLCLQRDIGKLRYSSYFGFCFSTFLVAIIGYRGAIALSEGNAMWPTPASSQNPTQCSSVGISSLPTAVSVFNFSFVFHLNVVPIYASLKPSKRTSLNMRRIVRTTVCICFALYATVGTLGYAKFGPLTDDNVLNNFSAMDDVINAARAAICMCCYMCLPLLVHPLKATIVSLVYDKPKLPASANAVITITLLALQYIVALLVPSVKSIFSFTGGTAVVGFCYVFPCIFALGILRRRTPTSVEALHLIDDRASEAGAQLLLPPHADCETHANQRATAREAFSHLRHRRNGSVWCLGSAGAHFKVKYTTECELHVALLRI